MLVKDIYHPYPKIINENLMVKDAVEKLLKEEFNEFIVVSDSNKVVGILSLQDIAAATVPQEFRKNISMAAAMYRQGFFHEICNEIKNKNIKEIMRTEFVRVSLSDNIMTITADFLKNDLYIVPVIEKDKLIGVVTRSEIKNAIAKAMGIV